ncbi:MAG: hypothetical protein AAGJ35_00035 [Myxococcota bacterium]
MKRALLSLLCLMGVSYPNIASGRFEHCNSLLHHGINNITKKLGSSHTIVYKWYTHCQRDYKHASNSRISRASIEIFGYGSGGGNGSTQQMTKKLNSWCKENENFSKENKLKYNEARTISDQALQAWNACQKNSAKGLRITTNIQGKNDTEVNFSIDSTSDGTYQLLGVVQRNYQCIIFSRDKKSLRTPLTKKSTKVIDLGLNQKNLMLSIPINNSNVHVNCKRKTPFKTEKQGVGIVKYEQGHISILTTGPAVSTTFPSVVSQYYVTPPKSVLAFHSTRCPPGWIDYKPSWGRFIRGIDKSKKPIDPQRKRKPGSLQGSQVGNHSHVYHKGPTRRVSVDNDDDHLHIPQGGFRATRTTGNPSGETRPHNVALLYCIRK